MPSENHLDRLTSIDASFLAQEKEGSHMHIGAVMIFDGQAPSHDEFTEHISERLHLVPRYRQKLSFPRMQMGRPLWIDDPSFNIDYHVRYTALPKPGGLEQLKLLTGRIFSQRLDRTKPLWEIWLIEGLEKDRFALINKTHHSLVDGVSGVDITTVLFDLDSTPAEVPKPDQAWTPGPEPSDADLVARGVRDLVKAPVHVARRALRAAGSPRETVGGLRHTAEGAGEVLWGTISSAPECPLNCEIGTHRRVTWVGADLADLKEVKDKLGGTVNDVFLAVVAGALNKWLKGRGIRTEGLELRGAIPVSVRSSDEQGELGNQITIMIGRLPTYVEDPAERLGVVSDQMSNLKESKQAMGAEAIGRLEDFAPPNVFARSSRLHFSTRLYNLLVTNVPGPQFPLYLLGKKLEEMVPVAFLAPNQALAVAVFSYDGKVKIGLIGDYDAMPDLDELAGEVRAAIDELLEAARAKGAGAGEPASV
ncbi:wax ester/triacylglycerol synthase family O-acyltransferase [soil metagenome]